MVADVSLKLKEATKGYRKGAGVDQRRNLYSLNTNTTEFDITKMGEHVILHGIDVRHRDKKGVGYEPELSIRLKSTIK